MKVLVIFGATGNLVQNKLLPAIYHLLKGNLVPEKFEIIKDNKHLYEYDKGTWGPAKATSFAKSHGCEWLMNTSHVCEIHHLGEVNG